MPGTLYLVATPIGNLQDMTLRAIETLRAADIIACEDTRHSRKLLNHFSIQGKLVSYHEHNEETRSAELGAALVEGKLVAVISDAGTPGICDPGSRLVRRAIDAGIQVVAIPGPVAFAAAVTASGLPTDAIFFAGFLPARKGERRKRLTEIAAIPATLVLYEAPHRLKKLLADCIEVLGNRQAAVIRELTKMHEEVFRGSVEEIIQRFAEEPVKGEITVAIDRQRSKTSAEQAMSLSDAVAKLEHDGLDRKAALKSAAKQLGISKSEAYRQMIAEKK